MKGRSIVTTGLVALALAGLVLLSAWPDRARGALEAERRALRQQGFKVDLADFDFSASAQESARAAALTNAGLISSTFYRGDPARRLLLVQGGPELMRPAGSNAAIVVWKQDKLPIPRSRYFPRSEDQSEGDLWAELRRRGRTVDWAVKVLVLQGRIRSSNRCPA